MTGACARGELTEAGAGVGSSCDDAASRAGDSAMGLGLVTWASGRGGETTAGVVLMPLMELFVEAVSSRSEDEERGATRVEARRTTVPMRDHLDLAGELMVDKGGRRVGIQRRS
jgi:hypothetical protein